MTSKTFIDQMGNKVTIPFPPKRIISLVPSQTEFLYDLGLSDEVVGQTLFCIHPDKYHQTKPRIGGTKNLKLDLIAQLKPDLIIANKEENEQKQIEYLQSHYPVWISDIQTLADAYKMMEGIGEITDKQNEAKKIVQAIQQSFIGLDSLPALTNNKVAYFIWRKPYMVAGNHTFINHLLESIHLNNVFKNKPSRYPEITVDELIAAQPEYLLLSSEPYPFKQKHIDELQAILPRSKILLTDGELFSWYGSRLQHSCAYFKTLLSNLA
ncbi:MAG: helical backbone metal receptor [Bacteroidota bacterium]